MVSTTIEVFKELNGALLSWYDAWSLCIIPEDYLKWVNAVCTGQPVVTSAGNPSAKQIEQDHLRLLEELKDIFINSDHFQTGATLPVMMGSPVKIHLWEDTTP